MAGLSEEQGRQVLAWVTEQRQSMDAALPLLRAVLGEQGREVTRRLEAVRDRWGVIGASVQTMLGPQDRGPAEVLELPKRKKGAHRA
jgi:hypothetical protein